MRAARGDATTPKATITTRKTADTAVNRATSQSILPATTSPTESGVATSAQKVRSHLNPPRTGYEQSLTPTCSIEAARRPGATKDR